MYNDNNKQQEYDMIQGNIQFPPVSVNDYNPAGVSSQTIDANFQIRNLNTGSGAHCSVGTLSISGGGNIIVTGLGFSPIKLTIYGVDSSGNSVTQGFTDGTNTRCMYLGSGVWGITSTYLINNLPGFTQAQLLSFDSDGFTINVISGSTGSTYFYIAE